MHIFVKKKSRGTKRWKLDLNSESKRNDEGNLAETWKEIIFPKDNDKQFPVTF
jgi:hypothetical protein